METFWNIIKFKFSNIIISDLEYNLIKAFLELLFKSNQVKAYLLEHIESKYVDPKWFE